MWDERLFAIMQLRIFSRIREFEEIIKIVIPATGHHIYFAQIKQLAKLFGLIFRHSRIIKQACRLTFLTLLQGFINALS